MPNWCENELHIFGASEDIKHFMEANKGLPARYGPQEWEKKGGYSCPTEPRFCFNALVPTPQAVLDLGYDGHRKLERIADEQGKEAIAGLIDGYHWNIRNWGTKWDIYWDNLSLENCGWKDGSTELQLLFNTAWAPPITWLAKVAPVFPKLRFEMHYEEPGVCFAGDVVCEGDFFEEDAYDDARCMKLFGFDDEENEEAASTVAPQQETEQSSTIEGGLQ